MEIVDRLKNKEEKALVEMMDLYGNHLLRISFLLLKDQFIAEEVVQDVFVIAFQKIDQLKDSHKLKSWLVMITTNECRSRMRKWSWKNIFLHKNEEKEDQIVANVDLQPEQSFLNSWRDRQIHEAIHELPYKYREVVTLYYFQEFSIKEITEMIGEAESTVKTRLSRGRGLLKKSLQKGGGEIVI